MKKITLLWLFFVFTVVICNAQTTSILHGTIEDIQTQEPIQNATISIEGTTLQKKSDKQGKFTFLKIPKGNLILRLEHPNYESQRIQVDITESQNLNLGIIYFSQIKNLNQNEGVISLGDDIINENDNGSSDYVPGLLHASRDMFLNTAAFQLSQARFKVRGYNSENAKILLNGVEMNKIYDGRPQWNNWGGLNDALRNRIYFKGLSASDYNFSGLSGTTNFNTIASNYRKGNKISLASTNGSYLGRVMATFATGLLANGWAFTASISRRFAKEGYIQGTFYDANSFFIAISKKLNNHQTINITALATPNRRGKSSPNTQEVYDLKGLKYNAYWGWQNGKKRNSRVKSINEPILVLSHLWNINHNTSINTNIAYQFGRVGNSRLGYYNAPNPDPTYYKNLPSYFVRFQDNQDLSSAYIATDRFIYDASYNQINWKNLYQVNLNNGNSLYYLYQDRTDDKTISANTILNTVINNHITLNASIRYKNLNSENFQKMTDLLGRTSFIDLDQFAVGNAQQNNLNNPNNNVVNGDKFGYNYKINATTLKVFNQLQFTYNKVEFYVSDLYSSVLYQRDGLFKNGSYSTTSFGKSYNIHFSNYGVKGGLTYKISGRNIIDFNGEYRTKAPTIRNTFANARVSNELIPNLSNEKISSVELNYIYRGTFIKAKLTGYYTTFNNTTAISYFFAQGLQGDDADFVAEILTGANQQHLGLEFGLEGQLTPSINVKAVASVGQYTYSNNPHLYLSSQSIAGFSDYGTAYIKDYKIGGSPQRAFSLGFDYRDPDFWWLSTTGNFLSNNYLDISPLLRTDNFYKDTDGLPINGISQADVDQLLRQQKFGNIFLLNVAGGKSWKLGNYYLGFFGSINNALNSKFKTGGFEQSRNANYKLLKEDKSRTKPIFGPKYWVSYGATYYATIYLRF